MLLATTGHRWALERTGEADSGTGPHGDTPADSPTDTPAGMLVGQQPRQKAEPLSPMEPQQTLRQDHEQENPIHPAGHHGRCCPVLLGCCWRSHRRLHPGRHRPGPPESGRQHQAARQQRGQQDQGFLQGIGLHAPPLGRLRAGQRSARGGGLHPLQGHEGKLHLGRWCEPDRRRESQQPGSVRHL